LETDGLTAAQMQAIAAEFNYAETTFVLPPSDSAHTAHVRPTNAKRKRCLRSIDSCSKRAPESSPSA
jgi:hypothetical protein